MIILDANILVSAIAGQRTLEALHLELKRDVEMHVPWPQVVEATYVLPTKMGYRAEAVRDRLGELLRIITVLELSTYFAEEERARARLGPRAQPDWPVLASALALDASI